MTQPPHGRGLGEAAQRSVRATLTAKVVAQFHRPTGIGGRLAGWQMATRSSNRQRNRWVVSLLDLTPDSRVLEVGFGPGIGIREAARRACNGTVIGVDHSAVMLRQATRRNASAIRAGQVQLYLGSADGLPPLDGPFDRIYAINSMGFWANQDQCLGTLRGLLRPNGWIAIASQPRCGRATADTTARAGDEIATRLSKAGCTTIRRETMALNPPAVCVIGEAGA